jgi:hypothetical protein
MVSRIRSASEIRLRIAFNSVRLGSTIPRESYLRDPRVVFFRFDWRCLFFFRFGLLMMKVPLPTYSAL